MWLLGIFFALELLFALCMLTHLKVLESISPTCLLSAIMPADPKNSNMQSFCNFGP